MKHSYFKKGRQKKIIIAVAIVAMAVIMGMTGYMVAYGVLEKEYAAGIDRLNEGMEMKCRNAYILERDVKAGERITAEAVREGIIYSSYSQEKYADEDDLNKVAKIDLEAGTQLMVNTLTEQLYDENTRDYRCGWIDIPDTVGSMDICDIRLIYPDGVSYIVLSKKQIMDIPEDRSMFTLRLTEEELSLLLAAEYDTYLYRGSRFCITEYIDDGLQLPSIVNYTPSSATISSMLENPNIKEITSGCLSEEIRIRLEERMNKYYE